MKILHIAPINSSGELPTFLSLQIDSLNEFTESELLQFKGSDLKIQHPLKSAKTVFRFWRTVRNSDADITHAHWGSILGFLTAFTKRRRSLMVLTLRGSDINRSKSESLFVHQLRRTLSKIAIYRSDYNIFVSDQLRQTVNSVKTNSSVIPDGTCLEIFRPISKNTAKNILDWDHNCSYVVFHCGQRPLTKNLELATQTIEKVKIQYPLLQFVVFENDLSQHELSMRLAAADALLFTSLAEGSPNIVREAIACGCPVVAVNVGDVEKWVIASGAGAICEYDPVELSKSICDVIRQNQRANYKIAVDYSTKSISTAILTIYSDLKGQKD